MRTYMSGTMENDHQDYEKPEPTPDEDSGFLVEGFLQITDPDTGETLLATRA